MLNTNTISEVKVIENDIVDVERNCEKLKCSGWTDFFKSSVKLIKDIIIYFVLCRQKKED